MQTCVDRHTLSRYGYSRGQVTDLTDIFIRIYVVSELSSLKYEG